jgi:hypothetical protein
MTQPYPSTIRMDAEIIRDRQAREKAANRDYMQSMIARAKALRGEPEDEDDLSDIVTQLTCRDGRNGGACND